jgi:hypothetical protein
MKGALYTGFGWDQAGAGTWRNMHDILGLSQLVGAFNWRNIGSMEWSLLFKSAIIVLNSNS